MGKSAAWVMVALALLVGVGVGWVLRAQKTRATVSKFRLVSALPEKKVNGVVKNVTNNKEGPVDVVLKAEEYTMEVEVKDKDSKPITDPEKIAITGLTKEYDVPDNTRHITLHVREWDGAKPKKGTFVFVHEDGTSSSLDL